MDRNVPDRDRDRPRDLDADGVRQDPRRSVRGRQRARRADRDHVAGRDGNTNLGPWVNRRKLFAREARADVFKTHNIPSTAKWEFTPDGQHIELGIAEMNLFLLLARPACRIRCSASG
jgi:hypothetical protein